MFVPGSYSFDTTLGGGNPETGMLNMTVPTGDLGMHMLFDWNGNNNIDTFVVFAQNSIFGSGLLESTVKNSSGQLTCESSYTGTITKNCIYDGPVQGSTGLPTKNKVWMLSSMDGDGDGVMGIKMMPGSSPLADLGLEINFSVNLTPTPKVVPVPAAVWLFGSGLMCLLGVAKRRKR
jgi:hypothetical protein